MSAKDSIGIVGGGPIGLGAAYALTENGPHMPAILEGAQVTVFDPGIPSETAGFRASAFVDYDWSATVSPRHSRWQTTSDEFYRGIQAIPEAGVTYGPVHVFRHKPRVVLEPGEYRLVDWEDLQPGFPFGTGTHSYRINPPVFLAWMRAELERRGVQFVRLKVSSFEHARRECGASIIVNAAGVHAGRLTVDPTLTPRRGHCARIHLPQAPKMVRLAAGEQTWCVAVSDTECRIGGSSEVGCWDVEPDRTLVDAMYRRVQTIMPFEFDPWAAELEVGCGLRPRRPGGVRLECDLVGNNLRVVHCYGHDGEGFTLIGCADEVRDHVVRLIGA